MGLKGASPFASFVVGHSIGEFAALTVAGSLTVRDVARITVSQALLVLIK